MSLSPHSECEIQNDAESSEWTKTIVSDIEQFASSFSSL
jgi:hypothetical protein